MDWYQSYPHAEVDSAVIEALNLKKSSNWIRRAREALFIPGTIVAKKLGISRSALSQIESRERRGTITIAKLQEVAEQMGCELVYAIRPKAKKTFSESIWPPLIKAAQMHPRINWGRTHPAVTYSKTAGIIRDLLKTWEFRKMQGWSLRRKPTPIKYYQERDSRSGRDLKLGLPPLKFDLPSPDLFHFLRSPP
jgi:transcriptional regulator with XRE-family HTH domain